MAACGTWKENNLVMSFSRKQQQPNCTLVDLKVSHGKQPWRLPKI